MKALYFIVLLVVFTSIGGLLGWSVSNETVENVQYKTTIFASVVSSDENSSVEEKETASHFFAEAVLGWTLSPMFKENLGFDVSSRKQERSNIIFDFNSTSLSVSNERILALQKALNDKLGRYNDQANTQFSLLSDQPYIAETVAKKSFWTMGGAIAGFFAALFLIEGWKFWRKMRSSELQK